MGAPCRSEITVGRMISRTAEFITHRGNDVMESGNDVMKRRSLNPHDVAIGKLLSRGHRSRRGASAFSAGAEPMEQDNQVPMARLRPCWGQIPKSLRISKQPRQTSPERDTSRDR